MKNNNKLGAILSVANILVRFTKSSNDEYT